jgi:hypothetical protein
MSNCHRTASGFVRLEVLLIVAALALLVQLVPQMWGTMLAAVRIWDWPQWLLFLASAGILGVLVFARNVWKVEIDWRGRLRPRRTSDEAAAFTDQEPEPSVGDPNKDQVVVTSHGLFASIARIDFDTLDRVFGIAKTALMVWLVIAGLDLLIAHFGYVTWVADMRNWSSGTWFMLTIACFCLLLGVRFWPDVIEGIKLRNHEKAHKQKQETRKERAAEAKRRSKAREERARARGRIQW